MQGAEAGPAEQSDHALGEALIDDVAWSPEGDRLLIHVVSAAELPEGQVPEEDDPLVEEAIYLVVLDDSFTRQGG